MKKNLPTIRQSTEVALSRANTLMDMADKILAKQSTDLVDEGWMERLWQWADDNDISDEALPRDKEELVNLENLDISEAWITEIPKEIGNLTNLTSLILDYNELTELPKEIGNLVNLENLSLLENDLTGIPKEVGSLAKLTRIDLHNNVFNNSEEVDSILANISPDLVWTHKLWSFLIYDCDETEYPPFIDIDGFEFNTDVYWSDNNSIKRLASFTGIYLCESYCGKIPKEIGNLVNLTNLDLSDNELTELPKEIGNLVNLTSLNLSNNQLIKLPKEIGNLVNLTWLNLSGNQLTKLPKEIENLSKLTFIRSSDNSFTNSEEVDSSLFNISPDLVWAHKLWSWTVKGYVSYSDTNYWSFFGHMLEQSYYFSSLIDLTELVVIIENNHNSEIEVPKEIDNLVNLKTLSFNGNPITKFPKEIGNLVNLECLDLRVNEEYNTSNLTKLPKEIGNLVNLTTLDLNGNELTELPKEIGNLVNLTKLDLRGNKITELPKEIGNLVNLTSLNLKGNQLTELPKEIGNLVNLRTLDLSNNNDNSCSSSYYDEDLEEIVEEDCKYLELPVEICSLINLKHIRLSYADVVPKEIQELSNLKIDYIEPYCEEEWDDDEDATLYR